MRCPKCNQAQFDATSGECPNCGFHGDAASLEILSHIRWLLNELGKWSDLGVSEYAINRIQKHYATRQREFEIKVGLRPEPFVPDEAAAAWGELSHLETLFARLRIWREAGHIKAGDVLPSYTEHAAILRQRLEDYPRPTYSDPRRRFGALKLALEALPALKAADAFTSPEAEEKISIALAAELASLEASLNPPETPTPKAAVKTTTPVRPTFATPPRPPAPPSQPLGERLRRSVLSERTLQALIFLGIFMLLTAAISFVISGWQDFSAPLRVGIPSAFTLLFIGLGWLVRTKTRLYRSGIALSAIAALLVPIDAYTIYANYIPTQNWAQFWLVASIFALLAYILLTLVIQSRFFGYLVAIAAGSLILASMEVARLPRDYYGIGLSALALGMLLLANALARESTSERLRVFVDPFRYLALWLPAVLMPLTMGQWLVLHRAALDNLQNATAVTWFLGGFVFGWGAVRYRSVGLGRLAALALPVAVYMAQVALFDRYGIHRAWQAFGLALLIPIYFATNHRLSTQSVRRLDPMLVEHANTASACGWLLVLITAIISLFDLTSSTPAAATHSLLAGSMIVLAILWQRPGRLYLASFFILTASSFFMTEIHFQPNQFGVGWASLAILYILLARLLVRFESARGFLSTIVITAYMLAALSVLPALVSFDQNMLVYTLGNFIALSTWGAAFAYRQQSGFYTPQPGEGAKIPSFYGLLKNGAIFHWFAALPLPYWLWIAVTNNQRPPDFSLALDIAVLAWGMVAASHWLRFAGNECRRPWRVVGLLVSVAAPFIAFNIAGDGYTPAIVVLTIGLLYFADALASRQSLELYPAALVTAWGVGLLLDRAHVETDLLTFALCLLIGLYLLCGLLAERHKLSLGTPDFLGPLYHSAHLIGIAVLLRIYFQPLNAAFHGPVWTEQAQLWGAADQLFLAVFYVLYAWGRYNKAWAFISVWLAAAGGGFLITLYSSGQGSLAAKAALIVTALILLERSLFLFKASRKISSRWRAWMRLFWELYRLPLLFTGWAGSVAVIGMALVRNYYILGGGRTQQIWAAVALLIVTALYALSARLFRQARFVWFAVCLVFIPWTILTNLGWFTPWQPSLTEFPISWLVLAWAYFLVSLVVRRITSVGGYAPTAYVTPLTVATRLLTPFSLLWAIRDVSASCYTVGMAIGLYAVAAWEDHRQNQRIENRHLFDATRFLYPAIALVPLWGVYWLKFLQPAARHEHVGLLLLGFAALGLLTGKLLERLAPRPTLTRAYGIPAYFTAYAVLIIGILLTAHIASLLAFALLYAALLMVVSAWLFRSALWVYPATVLLTLSLFVSLRQSTIPLERHGWWIIGLAAIYLIAGWLLRRFKLDTFASATINIAFVLIPLGLPASSQDRIGAFWGYGGAALLYSLSAFWLKQPLLLAPACALIVVPYASALRESPLEPRYYGLALLPGAVLALLSAVLLDARMGAWRDFPWRSPMQWLPAFVERILGWWALPLYVLGFGLATAMPFFAEARAELVSLGFLLTGAFYTWAIFRFRNRFWLVGTALALHLAAIFFLQYRGFKPLNNADFWLNFMPLTILTTALALWLEKRFNEGSPFAMDRLFNGWSRVLYLFAFVDVFLGQSTSLENTFRGINVSLAHALLLGVLASAWGQGLLVYIVAMLGWIALLQWHNAETHTLRVLPIEMAWLGLGYGLFGFGYRLFLRWKSAGADESPQPRWLAIWETPLQRSAMILASVSLVLVPLLGIDLLSWIVRALFGIPLREVVEADVRSVVWVFSLVGLLYAGAATVYQRFRLGYLGIGLLLSAWFLYAFYINIWDNLIHVQWYAMPTGLYMLVISYVEWMLGNKRFARWLDYAAILLLMGSLFWQTLQLGLFFCLMMVLEGLAIFGWGMARRLRRFFYIGIVGVTLAVLAQILNGFQAVNQWLVFGPIGLLFVIIGILVERKMDAIKAWEQRVLETWE